MSKPKREHMGLRSVQLLKGRSIVKTLMKSNPVSEEC